MTDLGEVCKGETLCNQEPRLLVVSVKEFRFDWNGCRLVRTWSNP